jgi:2-methylcitrate dehydratase PrpD
MEAATFIHNTTWNSLPAPAQRKIKMCLLDNLGAVIAGTLTRVSHVAADYAARCMAGDAV